jgi:cytochrome bd-type quinol oxidase subunit 2
VPFLLCVVLFLLALAGLAYSMWPYIVPRAFTLWDATSPPATLGFILAGVLILMPFVLTCTLHVPAVPGQGRPRGVRLSAAHVFRGQPFSVL